MTNNTQVTAALGSVEGSVVRSDGRPAEGVEVQVLARRLRSEDVLGAATTDADGRYEVEYQVPGSYFDLVVQVGVEGEQVRVVRVKAGADEQVDLRLSGEGRSEFAELVGELEPVLDGQPIGGLVIDEERDDHAFVARATGREAEQVAAVALAARHSEATGLSAELFYGLLSQGLPADLSELASTPTAELERALNAARVAGVIGSDAKAEENGSVVGAAVDAVAGVVAKVANVVGVEVADGPDAELAEFVARLRALEVEAAVGGSDGAVGSPVGRIFAKAVTDEEERQRLFSTYLESSGDVTKFWEQVKAGPELERLELALRVGGLADNDVALVEQVLAKFDAGEVSSTKDLVKLDGELPDEVRRRVAALHPTAYLTHRLANATTAEGLQAADGAVAFLQENPEFDLITTPVTATSVPDDGARVELAEIQRTVKLAPRFEAMQKLREQGLTSAAAVVSKGLDAFAEQVADTIDEDEARLIHSRATHVHAAAVNLIADLRTTGQVDVPWLARLEPLTDQIPNWEELFGSTDYCSCSECRSLYSQAAYLADLLTYLMELGIEYPGGGGEALAGAEVAETNDPLSSRRPDLWELKLSCDNTNLPLPYVDLVNELLESAVGPDTAVPGTKRQTSGDPDQLRVQPQHVNPGAYDKLSAAVYPWDLPYDLWRDQVNTALDHLGVTRETLLRATSTPGNAPANLVEESLGLGSVSAQVIAGEPLTPARTLPEYWGYPAAMTPGELVNALQGVRTMLDRAELTYPQLVAVLETRFVNPGSAIKVVKNPDSPCDTNTMTLAGLTSEALDRMHRFVRLQRILNWSPSQLDKAIATLGGRLDRTTLGELASVRRLAGRLDLSLDQTLVLVGRLDPFRYPADDGELPRYDRLFLDPTVVVNQPNPFELTPDRTEVKVVGPILEPSVTAALLAVLQISDEELALMVSGPRSVTPDRLVNLTNLSALVRTVTLARALDLTIADLLRLTELSGAGLLPGSPTVVALTETEMLAGELMRPPVPPLPTPAGSLESELAGGALPRLPAPPVPSAAVVPVDVLLERLQRFVDAVQEISAAGFGVPELEAVLVGATAAGGVVPADSVLGSTLTALRAALQDVYRETAQTEDEKGEATRKYLALLGWDSTAVEDASATLLGTKVYVEPLAELPESVVIPADLPVRYDRIEKHLTCTGPMTDEERQKLEALYDGAAYRAAVLALWDAPRDFVATRMKALRLPTYSAPLAGLPNGFVLPKPLVGRLYFDATAGALRCRGYLSAADVEILQAASSDEAFLAALAELVRVQDSTPVADGNKLFGRAEADAMFKTDLGVAGRFRLVLAKLAPVIRRLLSETTVKQQLGAATGLDAASIDQLLGTWFRYGSALAIETVLAPRFVGSDPAVAVTRAGFSDQFVVLLQLHRVALVLTTARIVARDLPLLFRYSGAAGWLDLNALPASTVEGPAPLFDSFVQLLAAVRLRSAVPGGVATLDAVFRTAIGAGTTVAQVEAELVRRTGWDAADVTVLDGLLGLDSAAKFADEKSLLALLAAVKVIRRLGVSAERATGWLPGRLNLQAAEAAWQAAKAKYGLADWTAVAAPIRDQIRERQRSALLSYLVANPLRSKDGQPLWSDEIGIHNHFLLDVEMGPCQQTTRMAQAIYSVQLFLQRCKLNLEPTAYSGNEYVWRRWDWMKEYRVWEANQKIFLYPENYTEPELRVGKSPFFAELENELLQGDVTNEVVEGAFLNYLEKLNDVARLQPCGMYSYYNQELVETTLYVFARSESTPRRYYFRTLTYPGVSMENPGRWTAWEHVDLDIEGETLVPIVWNERLYIFWLSFVENARPQPIPYPPPDGVIPVPEKHWEIRLNWSQYVNGHWQAKKVSQEVLTTEVPQYTIQVGPFGFLLNPPADVKVKENYICRPAIDPATGDLVVWCMLNGRWKWDFNIFGMPISFTMGVAGGFQLSARRGTVSTHPLSIRYPDSIPPAVAVPTNTVTRHNEFVERADGDGKLWVPDQETPNIMLLRFDRTPGVHPFRLLYPHQYVNSWESLAMFYTDGTRSYLLEPYRYYVPDPEGAQLLRQWATAPELRPADRKALTVTPEGELVPTSDNLQTPAAQPQLPAAAQAATMAKLPAAAQAAMAKVSSAGGAIQSANSAELVRPGWNPAASSTLGTAVPSAAAAGWYWILADFVRFYHPHVELFIATLTNFGIEELFDPKLQADPESVSKVKFNFGVEPDSVYAANSGAVKQPYPDEPVAFEEDDAYSIYNWELFFHAPLMIAERLSANQRFEEAQKWFHRIFDPTAANGTGVQRYWRTKPFAAKASEQYQKERIDKILAALGNSEPEAQQAVQDWVDHPFQPDVVARLRTTAYQKSVVMKYLDNLLAWGDQLFRRDTLESINQATQLYLLAAELLGRRPEEVGDREEPAAMNYWEMIASGHPQENPVTAVENLLPVVYGQLTPRITPTTGLGYLNYFRLPRNEKLLGYWDTVADRLFKIRHCQNIDGVVRQTPLFGNPIDPALLARAAAAGIDLGSVLDDINAPVPHYRFGSMLAKAKEFAAEVKAFGAALLTGLEKRDGEVLARLRSTQEVAVLKAARQVRQAQVDEAAKNLEGMVRSRKTVEAKETYYLGKKLMNDKEQAHQRLTTESLDQLEVSRTINIIASVISALPDVKLGTPTTIGATWGSSNIVAGLRGASEALSAGASMKQTRAALSSTLGGYDHRLADWQFQAAQAKLEKEQLDQQIEAGSLRLKIAEQELANQDLQIKNAQATDELLHSKFTNQELYEWMVGQISTSYFQAYQLAYDVAKRAERAYRHELGVDDSAFVKFGYWDSLHKGLLAGERLAADLNRMDAAYHEANAREFELSRRISVAQLAPDALQSLKQTGRCFISLPEAIFDLDAPGHYLRRIKNLSITVPCVAGPYTGVNLTATLLRSSVRVDPRSGAGGKYARQQSDPRFRDYAGPAQSIVTSTGQDDAGLFETDLHDERYLPFEGAGVISEWELSLPDEFRQFDYESITDVIMHLRYTARQGGQGLAQSAVGELTDALNQWVHAGGGRSLYRAFSVRREFADRWSRFLAPAGEADPSVTLMVSKDRFPYLFRGHRIKVEKPELVLVLSRELIRDDERSYLDAYADGTPLPASLVLPSGNGDTTLAVGPDEQPRGQFDVTAEISETASEWVFTIPRSAIGQLDEVLRTEGNLLVPEAFTDLLIICNYTVEPIGTEPNA